MSSVDWCKLYDRQLILKKNMQDSVLKPIIFATQKNEVNGLLNKM